jgi:thiol-disulfide isomerase/thioredoxin
MNADHAAVPRPLRKEHPLPHPAPHPAPRPTRTGRMATSARARSVLAGSALSVAGLLTGCSADADSDAAANAEAGFVAGNGVVTVLPLPERAKPGPVAGETLDGEEISLADYAGKTVVINVWGSWCAPCRAEADDLVEAAKELADDNVAFLGINTRDPDKTSAQAFARQYKVRYPSIYDQAGRTLLAFHGTLSPNAIPSTLVIDEEGRVAASILGETTKSTLIGVVEEVQAAS